MGLKYNYGNSEAVHQFIAEGDAREEDNTVIQREWMKTVHKKKMLNYFNVNADSKKIISIHIGIKVTYFLNILSFLWCLAPLANKFNLTKYFNDPLDNASIIFLIFFPVFLI